MVRIWMVNLVDEIICISMIADEGSLYGGLI